MTFRTLAPLVALSVSLAACGKVKKCEATEEARQTCLDEAAVNGVDTTYYESTVDCSDYGGIARIDPILGPLLNAGDPDFDCQAAAWEDGDCTTAEGLSAAATDAGNCF